MNYSIFSKVLIFASMLISFGAKAEILSCGFTEPFFSVEFDPATKVVTYRGLDILGDDGSPVDVVLAKNGSLVETTTTGPVVGSEYSLRNDNGVELMKIALTFRGSDGMSDRNYPFDAWYGPYMGGCETKSAPAVDTFELMDGLTK